MTAHESIAQESTSRERRITASGLPVIRVPKVVYQTIADEMIEVVDGRPYYELTLERDNGTYAWQYSIKFYAYFETDRRPDGDATRLNEVAPVWAEFHIWFSDEVDDLQNDFDAEKLRDHGIPYNKPFTTTGVRTGTQCEGHP